MDSGDIVLTGVDISNLDPGYAADIFNSGNMTITNSTVSNNVTASTVGNIINAGTMTITSCTLASNIGYRRIIGTLVNSGVLSLSHSLIVNGSSAYHDSPLVTNTGVVVSSDYNLFGDSSFTNAQAFMGFAPSSTDVLATSDGTDPTAFIDVMEATVDPYGNTVPRLADNGGPTPTIALVAGSPAIDAGAATCVPTDQRGVTRPQGPACDIGAFEVIVPPPVACSFHTEGYRWLACDGTTWVSTLDQLETYKANYGLHAGKYRNLAISANLGDAGTDLDIHSPCSIVVGSPVTLTAARSTWTAARVCR